MPLLCWYPSPSPLCDQLLDVALDLVPDGPHLRQSAAGKPLLIVRRVTTSKFMYPSARRTSAHQSIGYPVLGYRTAELSRSHPVFTKYSSTRHSRRFLKG